MVMLLGAVKMLIDLQVTHPVAFWTIIVVVGGTLVSGLVWLGMRVAKRFKRANVQ
jgi:hypothetical protein